MGNLLFDNAVSTYTLTLPSNGKKVKYRPFLVKEEKALLIAAQEGEEKQVIESIKDVIKACTFSAIDVEKLPTVDVEYLFIALRNKSLGEGLDIEAKCGACEAKNTIQCNLGDITVEGKAAESNIIELADNLKVTMKYPTLEMTYNLEDGNVTQSIEMVAKCIEFIEHDGKLHEVETYPLSEVVEFIEHLTQAQLKKINVFLESIPKTVFVDEFTCMKCGKKNNIRIEGISNFFV